jgi:integrase
MVYRSGCLVGVGAAALTAVRARQAVARALDRPGDRPDPDRVLRPPCRRRAPRREHAGRHLPRPVRAPCAGKLTVAEYAEQWRRTLLHGESTAERVERGIHLHIVPALGDLPLAQVRNSHIRGWVKDRLPHLAPSIMAVVLYGTLVPMFNAAVIDRRIGVSPCAGVRPGDTLDATYYIARPEQVHALAAALPERYRAIVYLAAGCGWRGVEIFGLEREAIDFDRREIHVRDQLTVIAGRSPTSPDQ